MSRKIAARINQGQDGFTLIELLVVVLIIGILAAIALPAYLSQQQKGQDASAKSNARNAVSHVESCYAGEVDYTHCTTATALGPVGIAIVNAPPTSNQVEILASTPQLYTVVGASPSGDLFTITKLTDGTWARTCSPGGQGGCQQNQSW